MAVSKDGFPLRMRPQRASLFTTIEEDDSQRIPMQIGRFFSLQQGRVGQYLSPRVLVVRSPFQTAPTICYFGFEHLKQAQTFAQSLAKLGAPFQMRRSKVLVQNYEIRLRGHSDLARTLAYWERQGARRATAQAAQNASGAGISKATIAA